MTNGLHQVIKRLEYDWDFVASFLNNPEMALRDVELSAEERTALTTRDVRALRALGLDRASINISASGTHTPTCAPGTQP